MTDFLILKKDKTRSLTDDEVADFLCNSKYIKLSRVEEASLIKKAQLSYYDEVSNDEREIFLDNYLSEFPSFKKKYDAALEDLKELLLEEAILDSMEWRSRLIENIQRYIYVVAKKYVGSMSSLSLMDLIQEGNIGAMKALRKFDVTRGTRFLTFADHDIKAYIRRAIASQSRTIGVPEYFYNLVVKVCKAKKDLYFILQRDASDEEIALEIGESVENVQMVNDYLKNMSVPASFDVPISEESSMLLEEEISDDTFVFEKVHKMIMDEQFVSFIKNTLFDDRTMDILFMYYGFYDKEYTLEEIGKKFNISKQRVHQIIAKALKHMRENDDFVREYGGNFDNLETQEIGEIMEKEAEAQDSDLQEISLVLAKMDLDVLDELSKNVLNYRYGVDYPYMLSLKEVSFILGIDEVQVLMVEKNALMKLSEIYFRNNKTKVFDFSKH